MESFGKKIKQLRMWRGLRQADVAEGTGLSRVAILHYEKDERQPSFETIKKLADFFGVPVAYFFEEKGSRTAKDAATQREEEWAQLIKREDFKNLLAILKELSPADLTRTMSTIQAVALSMNGVDTETLRGKDSSADM